MTKPRKSAARLPKTLRGRRGASIPLLDCVPLHKQWTTEHRSPLKRGTRWAGQFVALRDADIARVLAHVEQDPRVLAFVVTHQNAVHSRIHIVFRESIDRPAFVELLGRANRDPRFDARHWMPVRTAK